MIRDESAAAEGIRSIAVRGMSWQALATVVLQVLQAVVALTVARAVGPAEFALWGIASVVINAHHLGSLGLGAAVIYHGDPDDHRDAVDSAFVATIAISLLLGAAIFAAAPAIAGVVHQGFDAADVVRVVRMMAVVFVFSAIVQLPQALIEKTLAFRRRAVPESIGILVYVALALGLLRAGWGVWSLVGAKTVQSGLLVAAFWIVAPVRPRVPPRVHWLVLRRLFRYGKFVTASVIFGVLFANADRVAVGALAGAAPLGAYSLAYAVTSLAPTFLSLTLGKVFFPLYASIRADNVALRAAFTTALYLLGIIMLPATLGLLVVVPDALAGIFGEKWVAAGPLVRILALYGACRTLALASNDAGAATGRPDMLLAVEMIAVTVALLLLWPLAAWGAAGVAWAFTLGQGAAAAYGGWHTRRLWNGAVVRQLRAPALAAAVATLAGVFAARVASGFLEGWLALATLVVVYLVALMMADRQIVGIVSLLLGRGGAAHESAR